MHSPDLSQDNIAKIREMFPGCVTEARDEATGKLRLAVDFDQLRQELSNHIVEGPQERYRLDWPGKREALALANAPIAKTLRPARDESMEFDETKNLFIESDNLDALKLLQENYLGKVKLIYISILHIILERTLYMTTIFQRPLESTWSAPNNRMKNATSWWQTLSQMGVSIPTGCLCCMRALRSHEIFFRMTA